VDQIYATTNQLIELSAEMTARDARVASLAAEKLAMKVAQGQNMPEAVVALMDVIEITENALRIAQAQKDAATNDAERQALVHKTATLRALLNRIEESIENC